MKGKTVLVTGATNGIGQAVAEGLAEQGANLVIVGRNRVKGAETAQRLTQETGNSDIRYYVADLSVQKEVRNLAAALKRDLSRLDALINNAGAWVRRA